MALSTKAEPASTRSEPVPRNHLAKVLLAHRGLARIWSKVMMGAPNLALATCIASWEETSCAIGGGILCVSPFQDMCPASTPMATAFSRTELRVGALP